MKEKEITIIGGNDSLGLPYTPDNYDMKSFFDIIVDYFITLGFDVTGFNFYNPERNHTWDLNRYLRKNYSLAKIKKLHSKFVKDFFTRWGSPYNKDFIDKYYKINKNEEEIYLTDTLKAANKPLFLYSSGAFDAIEYFGIDPLNLLRLVKSFLTYSKTMDRVMDNIEASISNILNINSNTEIYVLGGYQDLKNKILRKMSSGIIRSYNKRVEKICMALQRVHYIDIEEVTNFIAPHDIHPTRNGQIIIANNIIKEIEQTYDPIKILKE